MPPAKAKRRRKDWYSISVDTLRGWGFLLLILAVLGLAYTVFRSWERKASEREAAAVIEETRNLLQRVEREPGVVGFGSELSAASQSFEQARTEYGRGSFHEALTSGRRARGVLLNVLDALSLPGSAGQARFNSIQGEVEYRRADGDDWEEARARVPLRSGDYVRTSGGGSAEILFWDGTLYTVRPNTQFIVSPSHPKGGGAGAGEQSIQMEYGWVDLATADRPSNVRTPGAEARVRQDTEAFVTFDKASKKGRFGAFRGGMELEAKGGLKREVGSLQEVVQTGDLLSEPAALPTRPEPLEPSDNLEVDPNRAQRLVLAWQPVNGATRYALQVSRNHLFVDNIIDVENRTKTHATLGLRGEGTFQWRVAAYGKGGSQGPWSTARKFRVAAFRSASGEHDATPPRLDLEGVKSYGSMFIVAGKSEPGAKVEVNGEPVTVAADGTFKKTVQINKEGWSFIEIRARDGWGNEAVQRHRVFVENL